MFIPNLLFWITRHAFLQNNVVDYMEKKGFIWKTDVDYDPMANGRAEKMVLTPKAKKNRDTISNFILCDKTRQNVLLGYRHEAVEGKKSPFESLNRLPCKISAFDSPALYADACREQSEHASKVIQVQRVKRAVYEDEKPEELVNIHCLSISDEVLVAEGKELNLQ